MMSSKSRERSKSHLCPSLLQADILAHDGLDLATDAVQGPGGTGITAENVEAKAAIALKATDGDIQIHAVCLTAPKKRYHLSLAY